MVKIIFIGEYFYNESNTIMSCIYDDAGNRHDWATIEDALVSGEEVHIRPATSKELFIYYKKLREHKGKHKILMENNGE